MTSDPGNCFLTQRGIDMRRLTWPPYVRDRLLAESALRSAGEALQTFNIFECGSTSMRHLRPLWTYLDPELAETLPLAAATDA
jgi:hypothetical protein